MAGKYDKRIDKGMAALDEYDPSWKDKINLRTLNLEDGNSCVLGQVFGRGESRYSTGYLVGKEALNLGYSYSNGIVSHGFDIGHNDTYSGLETAWVRKLTGFVSRA